MTRQNHAVIPAGTLSIISVASGGLFMKKKMLGVWLVVALLVWPMTLAAEQFGETVQVTVVEVPVTVADRAGNAVRGLTKNDFEVLDDGKKVSIGYFEVVDLASSNVKRPETKLPPAAYRNFLLLFDLAYSSPGTIGRARNAASEFVKSQISEHDVAAIATYTSKDGIRLLTNFTRDRVLLGQAIDSIGMSTEFHVPDALMITSIFSPSSMRLDPAGSGDPDGGEAPKMPGQGAKAAQEAEELEKMRQFNKMTETAYEKEQIGRIQAQISNFGNVALALDRLHGQKQIILLSEGFPAHLLTGRQRLGFKATQQENDAAASGELWEVDTEKRFGSVSGVSEINDMAKLFRRSDVRMHAIDISGLRTEAAMSGSEQEQLKSLSNEGLALMARPTGGTVFKNSNDLSERFRNLLKSQEVVYLLGIEVPSKSPGKFHDLKVKTSAKGVQVTHRPGYFELTPAANSMERSIGVAEVLVKDMDVDDIPVTLAASAVPGRDKLARVPVVMEISGATLANGLEGSDSGTLDVFVYAFDESGSVRDFMQQRVELNLAQTGEMLTRNGVRFFGTLHLPAGAYSIRSLARVDETARMGSQSMTVTVPPFGEEAVLTPMALDESTDWITILSRDRGQEAADLVAAGERPVIPKARVAIGRESDQHIALMLYRMPVENLAVTPSIVSSDGSTRNAEFSLLGRTARDEDDVTKLLFNLKPAGLERGSYDLRLTVTPKGGTPKILTMPFVVQ